MSSIEPDFYAEGKAAAELLDKMMRSRVAKGTRHLFFGVKRVVLRESTPHLPPAERLVARAREYIEKHATEGIAPADVAAHLGVSRPLLDLRFRETQKTSVGQLITATKLGEVSRRLRETKLSISAIQELCGFKNANALKNLFKSRYGVSMREWRAQNRID
jgi:AraC-like DNA-binding protein